MTLQEVKIYLRIDYEEDDVLLSSLIEVSDEYIHSCVGDLYKNDVKAMKLANLLQKKLILDMFENRGTEIPNSTKRDRIVTSILDKLSLVGE